MEEFEKIEFDGKIQIGMPFQVMTPSGLSIVHVTKVEGNKITILDMLKTDDIDYAEEIYKNDNIKLLKQYMNILTKREREIIEDRYGLNNKDELTQKEIAKKLNISRSYVSRLEKRATTKILREFMKKEQK